MSSSLIYSTATVLVVEDEPLLRMLMVDELKMAGFTVFEAGDADQAIALLIQHSEIRVVFTDIDMPGFMEGIELSKFVRSRWPPIHLVVASGHRAPGQGELPSDAKFFQKPVPFDELATVLRDWTL